MIGLDRIIGMALHDVARCGQQVINRSRIGGRLIGAHLTGVWAVFPCPGGEPASGRQIRFSQASTSMTCPNWSIARYR
jgi:hypothetical protein